MSDVSAIFGILLTLGIAFPGMLTAWWLLFPSTVERARQRLDATPWSCWWFGLGLLVAFGIPVLILLALPLGPAKFVAWILLALVLGVSGLGAAGLAEKMSLQVQHRSETLTPLAGFVRGAVALELAAVFPLIGWFMVIPIATVISLGATAFALLHWNAHAKANAVSSTAAPSNVSI